MSAKRRARGFEMLRHPVIIVAAVAIGAAIGHFSPDAGRALQPYGRLYLNLLVMCVIPLLFTAIISGLGKMVARHQLGRELGLVVAVFAGGLILAAAIGTLTGWATGIGAELRESRALGSLLLEKESTSRAGGLPGDGGGGETSAFAELFSGSPAGPAGDGGDEAAGETVEPPSILAYLSQLVPRNVVRAVAQENYLGILFFSILLGIALGFAPAEGRGSALDLLETFFDALLRVIGWVILVLPLGLLSIVAGVVAVGGLQFVPVLAKLVVVSLATTVLAMVVFTLTLWVMTRKPLGEVLQGIKAPLVVAFATASSMASIPAAMIALKRDFGLAEENVKLLLPLGVVINPIGSALFFSIAAIFAVQLHAAAPTLLGVRTLVMLVVGSALAGIAAMGLPATGALNMLGLILIPLGVPPEVGIIALLAVTPIIDPFFTMVNVLGNCAATSILDRRLSAADSQPAAA